jgi:hypothetical protein
MAGRVSRGSGRSVLCRSGCPIAPRPPHGLETMQHGIRGHVVPTARGHPEVVTSRSGRPHMIDATFRVGGGAAARPSRRRWWDAASVAERQLRRASLHHPEGLPSGRMSRPLRLAYPRPGRECADRLLEVDPRTKRSNFDRLKQPGTAATLARFREHLAYLAWADSLGPSESWLEGVPPAKVAHSSSTGLCAGGVHGTVNG